MKTRKTFAVTVEYEEQLGISPEIELMTAVDDYPGSPFNCIAVTSVEPVALTPATDRNPAYDGPMGVLTDYEGPDNPMSPPTRSSDEAEKQKERLRDFNAEQKERGLRPMALADFDEWETYNGKWVK